MAKSTIYKGDTINNFGRNLPVPYVERIELHEVTEEERSNLVESSGASADTPYSKIIIFTSLLFNSNDEFMLSDFTSELFNDLNINFAVLTNVDLINSLRESKRNLKATIEKSADAEFQAEASGLVEAGYDASLYNQFVTLPLETFSETVEFTSEYDENTNEIQKASLNLSTDTGTIELYVPAISDLDNLTIFCGVSVGPPELLMQFEDIVLALSFGDLAIEIVKIDGVLNSRDTVGFFDVDGAYWPGKTMLDLNGRYHMAEDFDQEDIKEAIDSLQKQYGVLATKDSEFERVFDNIDFIFSEYGDTPMYLTQLNRYRRVIKNQDQATRPGQFYERFRRLLSNANTALSTFPQVTKRITFSSKIRDYRPSEWLPLPVATFHEFSPDISAVEGRDLLETTDLLYPVFLQTSLAKYVSAHSTTGQDSLFQPEAPYTPNAMQNAYLEAVGMKFERFNAANQDGNKGMDNISDWVGRSRDNIIDNAVEDFKQAIQNFQDWATGRSSPDDGLLTGGSRDGVNGYRRIYWGGLEGMPVSDEMHSSLDADEDGVIWEIERNSLAFKSAKKFFGEHGNPDGGNCTLEFGYDTPSSGRLIADPDDPASARHSSTQIWERRDFMVGNVGEDDNIPLADDIKSRQYKCFIQKEGYMNVVGHGATYSDPDNNVFGEYIEIRDHASQPSRDEWGLRTARSMADTGGDSIRNQLENDEFLTDESLQNLSTAVETAFMTAKLYYLNPNGLYATLITDEGEWNQLVTDYGLLDEDGVLIPSALNTYAREVANHMEDWILAALNTLVYGKVECKTYRLRWCPDIISTNNKYDSNRSNGQDPYGGAWDALPTLRKRTNSNGNIYSAANEESDRKWFMQGGCGTGGGAKKLTSTDVGIGRHEVNPGGDAALRLWNRWDNRWRASAKDAIKDAINLIAEYHGVTVSTGDHKILSHVDIVTEKYGWFFFDLEKYIQKHSALSRYINPGLFQKYFEWGRDMVNYTIRIDDVSFYRAPTFPSFEAGVGWISMHGLIAGPHVHMKLNYNSSLAAQGVDVSRLKFIGGCGPGGSVAAGNAPYAKIKQMDVAGWKDIAIAKEDDGTVYLKDKGTGESIPSYNQFSYLMQRNYDFAYSDAIPDNYRMACFAYNYYIDDDEALSGPDSVGAKVTIRDRSDMILTKYYEYLVDILEGFTDYVALAEENCAYNSLDAQFNQFFINAMDDQYGDNMTAAPWLRAASAYALYEDIYGGRYGGEYSIVLEAASSLADNINPYTGNLIALQDFAGVLEGMVERVGQDAQHIALLGTQSTLGTVALPGLDLGGTPQYTEFVIGAASDETAADWGTEQILLDEGMIDYAADMTTSFPDLPDATLNTPREEGD